MIDEEVDVVPGVAMATAQNQPPLRTTPTADRPAPTMEACGMSFIKYLLFFFNLVFALSGLAVLIVGAIVLANVMQFGQFVSSGVLGPPIVLIVLGGLIFFIAFLGCCGAIKENFYMLIAFAVLLAIIFVIEIAVGIAASISKDEFTGAMRDGLRASMANYTKTKLDRQTWDNLHKSLKCCGVDSPRGWGAVVGEGQVPQSCCKEEPQVPVVSDPPVCPITGAYQGGCYEKMRVQVKDNIITIMGVGLGIAVIELAGIVLACCLASSVKKEQESKQEAVLRVWTDKEIRRNDEANTPEPLPISTIVTD